MARTKGKTSTPNIIETKIDIPQYCKNEAIKNKDELRDYLENEYRHRFTKTVTVLSIVLAIAGLIGTKLITDYINKRTKDAIDQTISQSIEKYVKPKIDSMFSLPIEPYKSSLEKSSIYALQTSAIAGSRSAFDKLLIISKSNTQLFGDAKNAITSIVIAFTQYEHPFSAYPIYRNGKELDPDSLINSPKLYFDILQNLITTKDERLTLVGYSVSFYESSKKVEIIRNCKNIINNSTSLDLCASVFGILKNTLGNKASFMDFDNWNKVIDRELGK
jgi:hypothetical protein